MTSHGGRIYILDDEQPMTCPDCGGRTEFDCRYVDDGSVVQDHRCLSCKLTFIGIFENEADNFYSLD